MKKKQDVIKKVFKTGMRFTNTKSGETLDQTSPKLSVNTTKSPYKQSPNK